MKLNNAIKVMVIIVLAILCWIMVDYTQNGLSLPSSIHITHREVGFRWK